MKYATTLDPSFLDSVEYRATCDRFHHASPSGYMPKRSRAEFRKELRDRVELRGAWKKNWNWKRRLARHRKAAEFLNMSFSPKRPKEKADMKEKTAIHIERELTRLSAFYPGQFFPIREDGHYRKLRHVKTEIIITPSLFYSPMEDFPSVSYSANWKHRNLEGRTVFAFEYLNKDIIDAYHGLLENIMGIFSPITELYINRQLERVPLIGVKLEELMEGMEKAWKER